MEVRFLLGGHFGNQFIYPRRIWEVYRVLATLAPVVWLDSYCASYGVSRGDERGMEEWEKTPIYWYGVSDAFSAAYVLRQIT